MMYYIKLVMVLFMMIGIAEANQNMCSEQCNAGFGELIGQSFLTNAYSNCNGNCVKNENNYVALPNQHEPIFSGMKWQCVEYARRWLIENKGVTFGRVEYAYHIWDLPYAETVDTHQPIPFARFENQISTEAPQVGDLLIYSVQLAVTGHVAVIVGIEEDSITIAEQNYFNRPWEGKNYARRLLLDKNERGQYRIFDASLIGWIRVNSDRV
jgi:hypothetical protein